MVDKKKTNKIELWQETVGKEEITVIKAEGKTTRINREKLNNAMDKIINDPTIRQKLDTNPVETMAEFGIEMDDSERAALAGKNLSEALAQMSQEDREAMRFMPPAPFSQVGVHIGVRTIDSPEVQVGVNVGVNVGIGSSTFAVKPGQKDTSKKY